MLLSMLLDNIWVRSQHEIIVMSKSRLYNVSCHAHRSLNGHQSPDSYYVIMACYNRCYLSIYNIILTL